MNEPLVPPDCDLRGLPWMPMDTVRLMDSDINAIASGDEFRAAVRLWCKAWHQVPAGSLPNNDRILATLSGYGPRWKKLREVALRGFVECSDGRLYHPVICEKAMEAWAHRLAQRDRAVKRWHGSGSSTVMPRHSDGNADAMLGTGTGQGHDKNQKSDVGLSPDASRLQKNAELRKAASQVIAFLNEKTGRNFDLNGANADFVVARLKDGESVDDCRAVIAMRCRKWLGDPKMAEYLRPKTLFNRTNFATYKGELIVV